MQMSLSFRPYWAHHALLLLLITAIHAQPQKQHVPEIQCQVCHKLAAHLFTSHPNARAERAAAKRRADEDSVIDFVEKSTTAWRPEGEWITRLHIRRGDAVGFSFAGLFARVANAVRSLRSLPSLPSLPSLSTPQHTTTTTTTPSGLLVVDMGTQGECGTACRTIEYAARKVMGEHDADVGEALYVGRYGDVDGFREWFCGGLTGACVASEGSSSLGGLDHNGAVYGAFVPREAGAQDVERILGEMADQGLRGKMYTREEAMEKYMAGLPDEEEDAGEVRRGEL